MCPTPPEDPRFDRLAQTLSVIALTLGDFRERIEDIERAQSWILGIVQPTRWNRIKAWFLARARPYR